MSIGLEKLEVVVVRVISNEALDGIWKEKNREQKIIKMQEPFSSPNPMKSDAKSPIFSFFVSSEAEETGFST